MSSQNYMGFTTKALFNCFACYLFILLFTCTAFTITAQTCPDPVTVGMDDPDLCTGAVILIADFSMDCMGIVTNSFNGGGEDASGDYPFGTTTVEFFCDGVSLCTTDVTVFDNNPPICNAMNLVLELDDMGSTITVSADDINDGSSDVCGPVTVCLESGIGPFAGALEGTDPNFNYTPGQPCFDNMAFGCCDLQMANHRHDVETITITEDGTYRFILNDTEGLVNFAAAIYTAPFDPLNVCDNFLIGNDDGPMSPGEDPVIETMLMAGTYYLVTFSWNRNNMVDFPAPYEWTVLNLACSAEFTCTDDGINTLTLVVVDQSGNRSECDADVLISDNLAPVCSTQDVTLQLDDMGNTPALTTGEVDTGSTDNCGVDSVCFDNFGMSDIGPFAGELDSPGDPNFAYFDDGRIEEACFAAASFGCCSLETGGNNNHRHDENMFSVTTAGFYRFTLNDGGDVNFAAAIYSAPFDPNNICANFVTGNDDGIGSMGEDPIIDANLATGDYYLVTFSWNRNANVQFPAPYDWVVEFADCTLTFDCMMVGDNDANLLVADVNGNVAVCPFVVTVEDNIAPICVAQDLTFILDDMGTPIVVDAMQVDNGSSDNCGMVSFCFDTGECMLTFDCSNIGVNDVVLVVTDANNQSSTCDATITIIDDIAPTCDVQDITLMIDETGSSMTVVPDDVDVGSTDNCSIDLRCFNDFIPSPNLGPFTGQLEESDDSFDYFDDDRPEEACFESAMFGCCDLVAGKHLYDLDPFVITADGFYRFTLIDIDGGTDFAGAIYTAPLDPNDICANFVSGDDDMVAVLDPEITTILHMTPGTYYLSTFTWNFNAQLVDPLLYEWIVEEAVKEITYGCDDIGMYMHELLLSDPAGNVSICPFTITVEDNIAPMCMAMDVTVFIDEAGMPVDVNASQLDDGSMDNCDEDIFCFTEFSPSDIGPFSGTLDNTTDPSFFYNDDNRPEEACYESSDFGDLGLQRRNHAYDTQVFTVTETGVYQFILMDEEEDTDFAGAIYSEMLDPANICANFVGGDDDSSPVGLNPELTIVLEMTPGTYYLVTMSRSRNGQANLPSPYTWNILQADCTLSFDCGQLGPNAVEIFVTDPSGNISMCEATVFVQDLVEPDCVAQDLTFTLDEMGTPIVVDGSQVDNGSTDNCEGELEFCLGEFMPSGIGPFADMIDPTDMNFFYENDNRIQESCFEAMTFGPNGLQRRNHRYDEQLFTVVTGGVYQFSLNDVNGNVNFAAAIYTNPLDPTNLCSGFVTGSDHEDMDPTLDPIIKISLEPGEYYLVTMSRNRNSSTPFPALYDWTILLAECTVTYTCDDVGVNDISLVVIDESGNVSCCDARISIRDDSPPECDVQDVTISIDETGNDMTITVDDVDVGTSDNCEIDTLCFENFVDSNIPLIEGLVEDTDNFFTYFDDGRPEEQCFDSPMFGCCDLIAGTHAYDMVPFNVTTSGVYRFTLIDVDGGVDFAGGIYSSTFDPLDVCANYVDVNDDSAGGLDPELILVLQMTPGTYYMNTFTWQPNGPTFEPLAYEWISEIAECEITYGCDDLDIYNHNLLAIDVNGNTSFCPFTVTVEDNLPPVCMTQDITVYMDEMGTPVVVTPEEVDNGTMDNCDEDIFCFGEFMDSGIGPFAGVLDNSVDPFFFYNNDNRPEEACFESEDFGCCGLQRRRHAYDLQEFTVVTAGTYQFVMMDEEQDTDFAGAVYSAVLNPDNICENFLGGEDDRSPMGIGPEVRMVVDLEPGTYYLATFSRNRNNRANLPSPYEWTILMAECNLTFDCSDLGDNEVVLNVTDPAGNTANCEATVTVLDTIAPVCTIIDPLIVQLEPLACDTMYEYELPVATDNCDPMPMSLGIPGELMSGDALAEGTHTVVYEVVDASDNRDTCSFDIIVLPYIPDGLACHETINLSLDDLDCEASLTPRMLLLGDEYGCLDSCTITITDYLGNEVPNLFTGANAIEYPYTYNVCCGDICCWGLVYIEDKLPPIIECEDVEVPCYDIASAPDPVVVLNNCGDTELILLNEVIDHKDCDDIYTAVITRTWTAKDKAGNVGNECTQTISVLRVDIPGIVPPRAYTDDDALECNTYLTDENGFPLPLYVTDVPTIMGVPIWPVTPEFLCNASVRYVDVLQPGGGCTQTIIRTWEIREWHCSGENYRPIPQVIQIVDTQGPHMYLPEDMTVNVGMDCGGSIYLPPIEALDDCNDIERIDVASPHDFEENGGWTGADLELHVGENIITYTAYDICYNKTEATMTVTVIDEREPVVVCDPFTKVSLNTNGHGELTAEQIDEGSFDECGPVTLEIAKMTDICGGDDEVFGHSVSFCCDEIGIVNVILQATDISGNTSQCMMEVEIESKYIPSLIIPQDTTVECTTTFDLNNLSQFGEEQVFGACHNGAEETAIATIDQCGIGKIERTFTVSNGAGAIHQQTQTIYFVNSEPFDGKTDINWPPDQMYTGICFEGDSKALIPPFDSGEPGITKDNCDLIGTNCHDQVFKVNNVLNACYKIVRTWTVVDWCQQIDGQYVTWDSVQIIEVKDDIRPEITSDPLSLMDTVTLKSCEDNLIEIEAMGETNCDTIVIWEYEIRDELGEIEAIGSFTQSVKIPAVAQAYLQDGSYTIQWILRDGCGNFDLQSGEFVVRNKKLPTAYAKPLSVPLQIQDSDTLAVVWVSDVDNGSYHECGYEIDLSFSKADTTVNSITFYCGNLGPNIVSMWVTDELGNQNFVNVEILVTDPSGLCVESRVAVSGQVMTPTGIELSDVEVNLMGSELPADMTDELGEYAFEDMPLGGAYTVEAFNNIDPLNGVSTLDIVMIQRHVLGTQPFTSPEELIAADVNNSEQVSAIDIVELRKLVLGIYSEFPNNTSWRFLDANFDYVDANDPWVYSLPESYEIPNLQTDMYIPFTGVKIGDVNFSASSSLMDIESESRSTPEHYMVLEEISDQAAHEKVFVVRLNKAMMLSGIQFELAYDGNMSDIIAFESAAMELGKQNYQFNETLQSIAFSWSEYKDLELDNDAMFYVRTTKQFEADKLSLESKRIRSEIYEAGQTYDLGIKTKSRVELSNIMEAYVYPNPWQTEALVEIELSQDCQVKFEIVDVAGKLIYSIEKDMEAGTNKLLITEKELSTPGVYYCKIDNGVDQLRKKMIKLR